MSTKLSRKPADVFDRIGAGSTRRVADRIVATFRRATPADIEAGTRWYGDDAEAHIQGLMATGACPTREHAAALLSHLSPRTSWARNVAGAYAMANGGARAARELGCIGANVDRAAVALASEDPLGTLNGPKTKRFAWNLLGYRQAVTVDVWAARVAFGDDIEDPERVLGQVGVYEAVEHAYKLAARRLGVDPTTCQATTWIVARGGRAA